METKKRLSAFYPTDLDFLLRNMRTETLVLNGGFTDCCILNTAFDASNHNYRVIVARDLVRGTDDNLENAALAMVSLHLGLVADAVDILGEWRSRRAGRKRRLTSCRRAMAARNATACQCSPLIGRRRETQGDRAHDASASSSDRS